MSVALNLFVWGCLALLGTSVIAGVTNQHVPGYPDEVQIDYYVRTPVVMMAITSTTYLLSYIRRATWLFLTIEVLALLFFFPFMFLYTGGI